MAEKEACKRASTCVTRHVVGGCPLRATYESLRIEMHPYIECLSLTTSTEDIYFLGHIGKNARVPTNAYM